MELSTKKSIDTWDLLLKIKEHSHFHVDFNFLCIAVTPDSFTIKANDRALLLSKKDRIIITKENISDLSGNYVLIILDDSCAIQYIHNGLLDHSEINLLVNYLPYSLLTCWAKRHHATYAISHFAQSLDGKIATFSGDSKWIGGDENLVHAHRMRALCDGILIGGKTLQHDCPKLTVRHVEGNNPVKIVVGNSNYQFDSVLSSTDKTVFFTTHNGYHVNGLDVVICDNEDGFISPAEILSRLYDMNIYSVYIEGGAYTTSQFLVNRALNEIQLYLAPSIMGSGISNFSLPAIGGIDEAIQFSHHRFFNMGNGIMFAGLLNHK